MYVSAHRDCYYMLHCINFSCQVWQHFDDGSCPGQGIGVRARLENGLSGFIHTKNLSDSQVNAPEERVHVRLYITMLACAHI